jgi:signal transduction histidine kinase
MQRRPRELASVAADVGGGASLQQERSARHDAEASALRMARLAAVTAALSTARTPDEVAEVAVGAGAAALGAARAAIFVPVASGGFEALRSAGFADPCAAQLARPVAEALRGVAVFAGNHTTAVARCGPEVASACGGALAALPLVSRERVLGVLLVGFREPRTFEEADGAYATALAAHCAQALDRAGLFVAERVARAEAVAARQRLAFLDEISALLAETVDESSMLGGVVRVAVPALGEWAGLFMLDVEALALTTQVGPEPLGASVLAHLRSRGDDRVARVVREGVPALADDFPAAAAAGAELPPDAPHAALVVPLAVQGRALGALAIATVDPLRRFGPSDLALVADVARRTALAVEHARLLEEARSAARMREEFLHVASHELRGPISTLRLGVQLLLRESRGGTGRSPEPRLKMIDRQADRLVRLAETLLDVSRATAGRLELVREEGDLAALVRDAAARYADEAAEVGSPLECDAEQPVRCELDAARLEQVLANLLSNAIKYGPGAPIRVSLTSDGALARIAVTDRGIGIAAADQARIFGRFERAVSGRHYAGLGLGLWIVQQIVSAHGGRIQVESAPGAGSTFTVELPISPP